MAYSRYEEGVIGNVPLRELGSRVKIKFEEIGNWRALTTQLDKLGPEVKKATFKALVQYGNKYALQVKRNIRGQGRSFKPPWPPLSPGYTLYKSKHGAGSAGLWVWTGTVYNSIYTNYNEKTLSVRVGVAPNFGSRGNRKGDPLNAAQVAQVLEHGSITHGVAARPLFYPTWRQMGGNAALGEYVAGKLSQKMKDQLGYIK